MMGADAAAQDVSQTTFISAYQHLKSFRGGSFRAWLLRITANNCYDALRKAKRNPTQPLTVVDAESGEEMDDPIWLADNGRQPAELAESKDLEAAIQRCIDKLDSQFRAVLILVDVQGMGYAEASEVIRSPIGTVRSRLARARGRVQDCLQAFRELLPEKYRLNHESKL